MSSPCRLVGYVTVREFAGFRLPVPVQNLVLRSYAQGLDTPYALPQCEHKYPGSYMQLFTTLRDVELGDHVGMCSAAMLPPLGELRDEALSIVSEKQLTLHLVFERIVAGSENDVRRFEDAERIASEVRRADGLSVASALKSFLADGRPA